MRKCHFSFKMVMMMVCDSIIIQSSIENSLMGMLLRLILFFVCLLLLHENLQNCNYIRQNKALFLFVQIKWMIQNPKAPGLYAPNIKWMLWTNKIRLSALIVQYYFRQTDRQKNRLIEKKEWVKETLLSFFLCWSGFQ